MRLRNKPWAVKLVHEHPESVIDRPDPSLKIDWSKRFADISRPLEIEVGPGKGKFITTMAEKHPEKNFVALELQMTAAGMIYLNFSDPWPKTRHEKRRLTYKTFLQKYQTVLRANGQVEFKTDNAGLFAYSLQSMNNFGMNFDFVSVDLHNEKEEVLAANIETEYEHKFAAQGNPIYALHADFGVK